MRVITRVVLAMVLLAVGSLTMSCEKGPAERAGEKVDRAVDDAKDAVKDATN